jgi:hypothetical protein
MQRRWLINKNLQKIGEALDLEMDGCHKAVEELSQRIIQ